MKAHRQLVTLSMLLPSSLIFAACSQESSPSDNPSVAVAEAAITNAADIPPPGGTPPVPDSNDGRAA